MRDSAFSPLDIPDGFWTRPDVVSALTARDIGELFRLLNDDLGLSQTRIGTATGHTQGRVSNIIHGLHKPKSTRKLTEIADGLTMPAVARAALGLADAFVTGTEYPQTAEMEVAAISGLLHADETKSAALLSAPLDPGAWNAAALAWLVAQPDHILPENIHGRAVGQSDVIRVRATSGVLAEIDNRLGGAHARRSLAHFLDGDAAALLHGRYTDQTGRELFAAVAEATLLAAWANYDCGLHGIAQRYYVHALRLAQAGNDRQLACSIMSAMSHQANYLGYSTEAANLARAACSGLRDLATPALTAQFRAMEARALARAGDSRGCHAALAAAEQAFQSPESGRDPDFIGYFNEGELAAEIAHCFRDLGDARRAADHASKAAPSDGQYARSDFFITMVLADALADQNEPGQACQTALNALRAGATVTSARCVTYVREFRARLARFGDSTEVRDFARQAASYPLWTKAA